MSGRLPLVLLFVFLTFCCWGTYGPVLHIGQEAMGNGRLRPFIGVGVAYFIVAVIIPLIVEPRIHEPGRWTFRGILWSLLAGTIGALGSLGVIFAFTAGGKPVFVMPLVFGCAPVVNTVVTMLTSKSRVRPGLLFYIGITLVALGAAGVLKFKPKAPMTVAAQSADSESANDETSAPNVPQPDENTDVGDADPATASSPAEQTWLGWLGTVASIFLTAVCWGCYGPTLHQGQARMHGSRLRPFICVGIAYFVVAIMIPAAILMKAPEPGRWTMDGLLWSLGAGGLGALGALGVIMAFTFGGKPSYVMPLVFGGAPIVNTLTSMVQSKLAYGTVGEISTLFYASLATVICGAVLVLLFAPKAAAHKPAVDAPNGAITPGDNPPGPASENAVEVAQVGEVHDGGEDEGGGERRP